MGMSSLRRIAIVGAQSTGKSWLARALTEVLRERNEPVHQVPERLREGPTPHPHAQLRMAQAQANAVLAIGSGTVIADTTPLVMAVYSHLCFSDESLFAMALEHQRLYDQTLLTGLDMASREQTPFDAKLRDGLTRSGIGFRVVYGQGLARLNNALLALGLPPEHEAAWQRREAAQFALNEGRTPWLCEKCSDPDCEHRLFTGLIQRASL